MNNKQEVMGYVVRSYHQSLGLEECKQVLVNWWLNEEEFDLAWSKHLDCKSGNTAADTTQKNSQTTSIDYMLFPLIILATN